MLIDYNYKRIEHYVQSFFNEMFSAISLFGAISILLYQNKEILKKEEGNI